MDLCRFLDWDSEFFSYRLAAVNGHQLDSESWTQIQHWAAQQRIDGLYFLVDSADTPSIQQAARAGFGFYGIRIGMDRRLTQTSAPDNGGLRFREAVPDDLDALQAITFRAYLGSRFYNDPHFSEADCDRLYQVWIRNSLIDQFADAVLIAEAQDHPVAFMTVRLDDTGVEASIPLVGVAESHRGQGVGQALMDHVLHWLAQRDQRQVSIGVDGRNIAAQRLYQKCGFRTQAVQLWYHKWFMDEADS